MRVASDWSKTDAQGATYYLHRQSDNPTPIPGEMKRVDRGSDTRASVEVRDACYRSLLDQLILRPLHAQDLRRRGLSDTSIRARGYKSWPFYDKRGDLCMRLPNILQGRGLAPDLITVPGFYTNDRGYLSLAGSAKSFAIPCRDPQGRIIGMQLRNDDPGDGPKYVFLSSWKHGGPSSGYLTHVPLHEGSTEEVRLTEGFLKADVATAHGGMLVVGMASCSSYRGAVQILRELGAKCAVLALDADVRTNHYVTLGMVNTALALEAEGFEVAVEGWDPALGKGIDDVLTSGNARLIKRAYGDRAWASMKKLCGMVGIVPPYGLASKGQIAATIS